MSARPSWAGGMAWFSQPCDFSVLPTLIPPPTTPAILRRSRSLPEIRGLEIVQGFAWIFNRPFTLLFPLLSAVFAEWFLTPPRVRYQQHYTAVLSCRSWTLFALNLTGTKKVFLFIILYFFYRWNRMVYYLLQFGFPLTNPGAAALVTFGQLPRDYSATTSIKPR